MRTTIALTMSLLATGCLSNWTGEPFDDAYGSRPYWPDCDCDGWGDTSAEAVALLDPDLGTSLPVCIDVTIVDPPLCPAECAPLTPGDQPPRQEWRPNGFDCDDGYALSGSRVGSACPSEFGAFVGESVASSDYAVIVTDGREFLIWNGFPVGSEVARVMCEEWSGVPADPTVVDEVLQAWSGARDTTPTDGTLPQIGMPENDQQLAVLVDHVRTAWDEEFWLGWVDVSFNGVDWAFTQTLDGARPLEFCTSEQGHDLDGDGTIHPDEIYQGLIDGAASDEFLEEIHAEMRAVLRIDDDGLPCLVVPTSTCVDGASCTPEANLLCERPVQVPQDRILFELGDVECLQVGLDEG